MSGTIAAVAATPAAGFVFVNWTENARIVGNTPVYEFAVLAHRSIVANFAPQPGAPPRLSFSGAGPNTFLILWHTNQVGFVLQENTVAEAAGWVAAAVPTSVVGTNNQAILKPGTGNRFFRAVRP